MSLPYKDPKSINFQSIVDASPIIVFGNLQQIQKFVEGHVVGTSLNYSYFWKRTVRSFIAPHCYRIVKWQKGYKKVCAQFKIKFNCILIRAINVNQVSLCNCDTCITRAQRVARPRRHSKRISSKGEIKMSK